ncbi:hypothetical protein MRY87_11625 [bacterium]|nr:hypothetical protein [bacterium]
MLDSSTARPLPERPDFPQRSGAHLSLVESRPLASVAVLAALVATPPVSAQDSPATEQVQVGRAEMRDTLGFLPAALQLTEAQQDVLARATEQGAMPDLREYLIQQFSVQNWAELERGYTGTTPVRDRIDPDRVAERLASASGPGEQEAIITEAIFIGVQAFGALKTAALQDYALEKMVVSPGYVTGLGQRYQRVGDYLSEHTLRTGDGGAREALQSRLLPGDMRIERVFAPIGAKENGVIDRFGGVHYFPGLDAHDIAIVARNQAVLWKRFEEEGYTRILSEMAGVFIPGAHLQRAPFMELHLIAPSLPPSLPNEEIGAKLQEAFPGGKAPDPDNLTPLQELFIGRVSPSILYTYFNEGVELHPAASNEEIASVYGNIDFERIRSLALAVVEGSGELSEEFRTAWQDEYASMQAVVSQREAIAMKHALEILAATPADGEKKLALEFGSGHFFDPSDVEAPESLPQITRHSYPGVLGAIILGHDTGAGLVEVIRELKDRPEKQTAYVNELLRTGGWLPLVAWRDLQEPEAQLRALPRVHFAAQQGLSADIEEAGIHETLLASARTAEVRAAVLTLIRKDVGINRSAEAAPTTAALTAARQFWQETAPQNAVSTAALRFLPENATQHTIDYATPLKHTVPEILAVLSLTEAGRATLARAAVYLENDGTIFSQPANYPRREESPFAHNELPAANAMQNFATPDEGDLQLQTLARADLASQLVDLIGELASFPTARMPESDPEWNEAGVRAQAAKKALIDELSTAIPGIAEIYSKDLPQKWELRGQR